MNNFILPLILVALLTCSGCTDNDEAKRVLTEQGYSNIALTGFELFDCSYDYFYRTGFTATAATGKSVEGAVCSGTTTLMPRKPALVLK